jgi:hypothetical protein
LPASAGEWSGRDFRVKKLCHTSRSGHSLRAEKKERGAPHASGAAHSPPEGIDPARRYFCRLRDVRDGCLDFVREPVIRMSTRRRALGSQPGRAASSEWTRKTLRWEPTGPGLIEDLTVMKY